MEQTEQLTLEKIGKKLRITRERNRQREKQALRVLQDIFQRQNYVERRNQVHRCPTDLYMET
jgi:DNA-directed RNA polymerase sigma subunit (sigma70/sigma32)